MATRSRSCSMLLVALCVLLAAQSATAAPVSLLTACGVKGRNATALKTTCTIRKAITSQTPDMYQAEPTTTDLVIIVRFAGITTARVLAGASELPRLDGNRSTSVGTVMPKQGGSILIEPTADGLPVVYTITISPRTYELEMAKPHQAVLKELYTACCKDDTQAGCKSLATPADLCTDGLSLCNSKGLLTHLILPGTLNCAAGLPPSLATLTTLEVVDLTNSGIVQEANAVFKMFGEMGNLQHIHLARNKLSGPLDDAVMQGLGPLPIKTVDVSYNALAGNMSQVLMGSPTIEVLVASNNMINGAIPPLPAVDTNASDINESGISKLQILDLSVNQLVDSVATTLQTASLLFLDLHTNNLTFGLPESNPKTLVYYDVSENNLTPSQFLTTCTSLVYIDVSNNELYGGVGGLGAFVPNASPLRYFYAANASIFTEIPGKLGAFPTLREVLISGNQLSGTLDAYAAAIPANNTLLHFDASNNQLRGGIPDAMQTAAIFSSPTLAAATFFSEDDPPVSVPASRVFDVSGNAAMSGSYPPWMAAAAARNAEADRQAGYDPRGQLTVVYDLSGTTLVCPDSPDEAKLDATGVIAIQNLEMTCYDNVTKGEMWLQDALYKLVPGLPAPPPPPVKFITRPGPSKTAKTWRAVGIALGVLFALALVACLVFAWKWRDLDLKLKQRYHKQDGDEFKQNYVVSPKAAGEAEDVENGHRNGNDFAKM